jgi:hypothetical protein
MKIGAFRKNVGKTLTVKSTKLGLKTVAKNTARTNIALGTVALKVHTGQLLQTMNQYLLGVQQTQEMKDSALPVMGNIGYDLALLAKVLKGKLPSSTKKIKLVGTRAAAILMLDGLATDLLVQVQRGAFQAPKMTTVKKLVSMPLKGGAKEERNVEVVDSEAENAAETERQTEMKSFLSGAVDVYWRLCFDLFGQPPVHVLEHQFKVMQQAYPSVEFNAKPKVKKAPAKAVAKVKKSKAEAVSA